MEDGRRLLVCSVFAFSIAISIYQTYTPTANIMKMEIGAMALCSLGAATAFVAPSAFSGSQIARVQRTSATTKMAVNDMLGADVETDGVFDPLGYGKDDASLFRRRAVELKHGRVAMLAVTGYLFAEQWHPLYDGKLSPGLKALGEMPFAAWVQILAVIAVIELTVGKQDYENKAPGELGNFGQAWNPYPDNPVAFSKLQLKELKNGRLAMLAIMGEMVQEALTGQTAVEQLTSGHISPFGDGQGFF